MNARARRRLSRERIEEIRAETFAEHEAGAPITMAAATIVRLCDELLDLVAPVPSGEVETPGFCTLLGQTCSHPDCDEGRNCPKRLAESYNDSTSHAYLERKVQQLAGEVETPCATCGGKGTKRIPNFTDNNGRYMTVTCPDCGVETPEAAVEAAIGAMSRAIDPAAFATVDAGFYHEPRTKARAAARAALDALIAQGWTPPGGEER